MATKIVEQCKVAPATGAPTEQVLKLLHMDMLFLFFPTNLKTLFFYRFHCSESHFMDSVVPNLKNSLSIVLKLFPPLAGKILIDHNSGLPVSRYVDGQDSVSLTIAVSYADFSNLTSYHPDDAAKLHGFAPDLNQTFTETSKMSVVAVQLTLFPNQGICVGLTGNHAIGDGATMVLFLRAWTSINKSNGDDSLLLKEYLPFYDRDLVRDGYQHSMECWRDVTTRPSPHASLSLTVPLQKRMLKATFVLSEPEIEKLKNLAIVANSKKQAIIRVSTFAVACAHLWTCLAKSAATAGEEVDDDEPEYFIFPVNCRRHLNPPLPDNYFGNCMAGVMTESTHGKLGGKEGFLAAAEAISGTIQKTVGNGRGTIDGSPKFYLNIYDRLGELLGKRMLTVMGSPGLDYYGTDFGWGRPIKIDSSNGDDNLQIAFLRNSRENQGGVEIGVSMPKVQMDAFAASFKQSLTQETEKLWCKM